VGHVDVGRGQWGLMPLMLDMSSKEHCGTRYQQASALKPNRATHTAKLCSQRGQASRVALVPYSSFNGSLACKKEQQVSLSTVSHHRLPLLGEEQWVLPIVRQRLRDTRTHARTHTHTHTAAKCLPRHPRQYCPLPTLCSHNARPAPTH